MVYHADDVIDWDAVKKYEEMPDEELDRLIAEDREKARKKIEELKNN